MRVADCYHEFLFITIFIFQSSTEILFQSGEVLAGGLEKVQPSILRSTPSQSEGSIVGLLKGTPSSNGGPGVHSARMKTKDWGRLISLLTHRFICGLIIHQGLCLSPAKNLAL